MSEKSSDTGAGIEVLANLIVVCKSVAKIKLSEPRTHNIDF
jgi:hypothetical protein